MALRGQFGDMFGAITAFFTGLGFVAVGLTLYWQYRTLIHQIQEARSNSEHQLETQKALTDELEFLQQATEAQIGSQDALTEQVKLLQESIEAETRAQKMQRRAQKMQRRAVSMTILTSLSEKYDSMEFRNSRYIASKFFLDTHNARTAMPRPDVTQQAAIRDILGFFEQMAHFTNRQDIEEDMVLNAFYASMEAYWYFADRIFLPEDYISPISWMEIRKLRERIPEWLSKKSEGKVPVEEVRLSTEKLIGLLEREVVRCKPGKGTKRFFNTPVRF
jgi:hypothetical protein